MMYWEMARFKKSILGGMPRAGKTVYIVAERYIGLSRHYSRAGFGSVYQGWIDESMLIDTTPGRDVAVAVKRLNLQGYEGYREWLKEAQYLGKLYHPNLVKLFGFSSEDAERLLVYEFMPRGSLDYHLSKRGSPCQLPWSIRMKIALGAAKALAFLHSAKNTIIHCDFTSSNILLDSSYNAKLSDFGFAKDGCNDDDISDAPMLTTPYAAPECIMTGRITAKSNVYCFGVVLLEILSRRRAFDPNRPFREINLVQWATPYLTKKQKIFIALDEDLRGQCSRQSAQKVARLVLQCLATEEQRPSMEMVVKSLEQLQG
ncbi:hypothetical protein ACHQM5_021311 [Ranunculus cassubicifolius]